MPAISSRNVRNIQRWMVLPLVMVLAYCAPRAQAAAITWGAATGITGDTDVDSTGTPVLAYFWDSPRNGTVTVNGVDFENYGADNSNNAPSQPGPGITISGFTHNWGMMTLSGGVPYPGLSLSANYCKILNGMLWGDHATHCSLTLLNLTVGQSYMVQIWSDFSQASGSNNPVTLSGGGGNSVTLHTNTADATGGVGQYAKGTFVADAATQTISVDIGDYVGINAIQVRTGTPVPVGLGGGSPSGSAASGSSGGDDGGGGGKGCGMGSGLGGGFAALALGALLALRDRHSGGRRLG